MFTNLPLIVNAIRFSDSKHKGQKRKVSGQEYITHPIAVSYLVPTFKKSKHIPELIAAAILHDILEDTDTTKEELKYYFGDLVSDLVEELTSDKEEIEKIGKNNYLKKKLENMSNYALFLKLVDRYANIMDNPTDKYIRETIELLKYLKSVRTLTKSQENVFKEILYECSLKINTNI